MEHEDVLKAIDQILNEPALDEPYDPACPGIDRGWWKRRTAEVMGNTPQPTSSAPTRKTPVIGCTVQRSDHQNRRKQQWLTTPPPPLAARPPVTPSNESLLKPARVMGPLPPPPIPVEVQPGIVIDVPHFAAHVARLYKTRFAGRRWAIRFNADGTVRSTRELN